MKTVLCPVCLGKGRIPDESFKGATSPIDKQCHGCAGKGWVEVHEDIAIPGYYIPYYPWHRPYNPYETTSP